MASNLASDSHADHLDEIERVPALMPARMLNEFVYCPRLFHIEWVHKLFVENEYTADGRWEHRALDEGTGGTPATDAGSEEKSLRRTAVTLSSAELGVIAKIDAVEFDGTRATPVESKRGSGPDGTGRPALNDEVQVCVQALLLREQGYECRSGYIFWTGSRKRVEVQVTDDLVNQTLEILGQARQVAAMRNGPPPLLDSPKCDGCSLVGICLPDETNFLRRTRVAPPRRLIPTANAARPLYLVAPNARVGKRGGRVEIKIDGTTVATERLIDISEVCVFGNSQLSTQLIRELLSREIPICWFSSGGWLSGIAEGLPGKNIELRRRQFGIDGSAAATAIAARMIEGKIRNSRTLLMRNTKQRDVRAVAMLKVLANRSRAADATSSLLGYEGTAARLYFSQFATMIKVKSADQSMQFDFTGRNRRPPLDPVNCVLSFCYGLLTKECVSALRMVGFDPYLGVLHAPRFGRPALALDLAEEFRPLVADSVALTAINNRVVSTSDFVVRSSGVALTTGGRRALIGAFERRMTASLLHPLFEYQVTYRRALELQARVLAAVLLGELGKYEPLVTR